MNRLITALLLGCLASTTLGADTRLEQINAIKKNSDYLYGEATLATKADATSLAYELLQKEVFGWALNDSIQLKVTSVTDINRLADTIMTRRADMYRVFAYVRKSALMSSSLPQQEDTVNTVKSVQPVKIVKPAKAPADSLVNDSVKNFIKQRFLSKRQNDALNRLKKAKTFFELKEIMLPLKEEGKIMDYGKYVTAQHPEECYLIVYDPAGNIRALLGKGDDVRKNLNTGRDDSIRNYRGCGALWFILNEKYSLTK